MRPSGAFLEAPSASSIPWLPSLCAFGLESEIPWHLLGPYVNCLKLARYFDLCLLLLVPGGGKAPRVSSPPLFVSSQGLDLLVSVFLDVRPL